MTLTLSDKFFNRFFPVPTFLAYPSFGVEISDDSIKFLELENGSGGIRVGKFGEVPLPPETIDAGKIINPKKLTEILSSLRSQAGLKSARVSLPEEQVYLFKIRFEKTAVENIRESIELSLEEHVPIQASEAVFDYELISQDAQSVEVQVAAVPKNIIDPYLSVFRNAQIAVQSFELGAEAMARAVIRKGDMETYMIVDFRRKSTGIFIVSRGMVMFTFTLDVGGVMLDNMIAKNFEISLEEAEKMKRKYGLERNAPNKELFSVLLNSVSVLRDEVVKHFLYWHTHKDAEGRNNPPIKKIILCGGDSNLIGLSEYFSISIKSPVEVANVWTNIADIQKSIPDINFKQALSLGTAIGLSLGNFENK